MRVLLSLCLVLILGVFSTAFPSAENFATYARSGGLDLTHGLSHRDVFQRIERQKSKRLLINSIIEPINVSGAHAWQAPDFVSGAQRGPCPGLNALANHGYIDRSGIANFLDLAIVINEVYGMDLGLATILNVMGTVWTGDPVSLTPGFSLDTYTPVVQNLLGNLLGLLGEPRGIGRSHNWLEADASLTRDDLYVTGNASTMNFAKFLGLYNRADANGVISTDTVLQYSIEAIDQSIGTNPYFWYGPVTGAIARNAGIAFAVRLLANHSTESPGGILTKDVFASFWGVTTSPNGTLTYDRGHERIPSNWYKIPVDYSLISLNLDLVSWFAQYPRLASIGGNTGSVNAFTPLDISNITGGVLNAESLLKGNNLVCFALQVVKTFSPDSLSSIWATLGPVLSIMTDALSNAITDLSCAPFKDLEYGGKPLWDGLLADFAGPAKAGSAL